MVFGIDETIERRRGRRISRDTVRSSEYHVVKTTGLRWISLMWLANIPWAHRGNAGYPGGATCLGGWRCRRA